MSSFRKKPVVVEAWRIPLNPELTGSAPPAWLMAALLSRSVIAFPHTRAVHIMTLEGVMVANPGDWIIQGVKGELYSCKADIFDATYEAYPL